MKELSQNSKSEHFGNQCGGFRKNSDASETLV